MHRFIKHMDKIINPLDAMGISLNKQNFMYKVLAPSIITPYEFLWTYGGSGHMCQWLVKC